MFIKRIQLALIHVAVAMTLVPINSTLNRVMIKEMGISAFLVAVLASLPYLFSPLQVVIGAYSDRHPLWGYRRSPYIAIGLLLCVAGVTVAPQVVFLMAQSWWLGLALSILAFGAWGMGFNFASVSYLALASEISGEKGRSRTVSIMWFMMIAAIIATSITLSRLMDPYSPEVLKRAFEYVGLAALLLGALGLFRLEKRSTAAQPQVRQNWQTLIGGVLSNRQARYFFFYLIILLAAILGQDVLLEPYAGEAFHLPVQATTRITSIWGTCVLVTLLVAGMLEKRMSKKTVARIGGVGAMLGFILIALSGGLGLKAVFYAGVTVFGLATGLATVSNLALMLDMTTSQVGLFIGAWGVADALARMLGSLLSGGLRDLVASLTGSPLSGYITVFSVQALMMLVSLIMLNRIDTGRFKQTSETLSPAERMALANES
jgi:BCD family chlorophyll transporter-like MFS transporter